MAVACRTFSTENGQSVIVKPEHAEFVEEFLDSVYHKPSLDYFGYSQSLLSRTHVSDSVISEVEDWVKTHIDWSELWMIHSSLRVDDFKNQFDLEHADVKSDILKPLARWKMIEKGRQSEYRKTPAFISLLKKVRNDGVFSTLQSPNGSGPINDPDSDIPF